ncbi:SDR family NAD(P)-dependent oxidoreductase [Comamonas thiooxydans]|uniref:SDR family NAD(P)-dependent oxidoreductase n=1 Tax=Comamonas thiooxydans TaxID=363952 RepID=UPI000579C7DE|nr:SDR family oxidoreductase [Comamonas thiooxydans]
MNQRIDGLRDKVILVTGGTSGLGLATAQVAAANGAKVICADLSNSQKSLPEGCEFQALDVADWKATEALAKDILARYGQIDGLVTSAGVSALGDVQSLDLQEWDKVLRVNLTGSMLSARAVAAHMKQRKTGSIVTIASINGMLGNPANLAYCSSKGGVLQMMRSMAADLGQYGVRVNAISPGLIDTPMTSMLQSGPARLSFMKQHLLGRAGNPLEVGHVAAFLLSDLSSFVTGANIPVDGGFSAAKVIEVAEAQ